VYLQSSERPRDIVTGYFTCQEAAQKARQNVHCLNQRLRPGIHEGHSLSHHFSNVVVFDNLRRSVRKPYFFLHSEAAVEIFVVEPSIFNEDEWLSSAGALQ
jgi:hypothetical protein